MPRALDALHGSERRNPHLDRIARSALSQKLQRVPHGKGKFESTRFGTQRSRERGTTVVVGDAGAGHATILAR